MIDLRDCAFGPGQPKLTRRQPTPVISGSWHSSNRSWNVPDGIVHSRLVQSPRSPNSACAKGICMLSLAHHPRHNSSWPPPRVTKRGFYQPRQGVKALAGLGALDQLDYPYENGLGGLLPAFPPGPVQFPRKPLNRPLAVLLLRSSYETVDDLDFIAMDKFQVQFWKLRQAEVEPYSLQISPLKARYGDVSDPLYFDFISFAQYAAISKAMAAGQQVFQEKKGVEGELQTVRRDTELQDNRLLPAAFKLRAGDKIYLRMLEGFEEEKFDVPEPLTSVRLDPAEVYSGCQRLLGVFVSLGYALSASVSSVERIGDEVEFKTRVGGPAIQWGIQALASRRCSLLNDFHAMALLAWLRASNRKASYRTKITDSYVENVWRVQ